MLVSVFRRALVEAAGFSIDEAVELLLLLLCLLPVNVQHDLQR